MKSKTKIIILVGALLLAASAIIPLEVSGGRYANTDAQLSMLLVRRIPRAPIKWDTFSIFRTAPLEVAKVYGRAQGCSDADANLIESTARAAIDAGLDPAIAAATVATESGCNSFAVSSKGAIGIMQVMPKIWAAKYDFAGDVNLFNTDTNLRVGAQIEAGLISQYGTSEGVRRYNGVGVGCATCDSGYTSKILALAGRR